MPVVDERLTLRQCSACGATLTDYEPGKVCNDCLRAARAEAEAGDAQAGDEPEFNGGSETITHIKFTRSQGFGRAEIDVFRPTYRESLEHRFVRHSPDGFEFGYHGSGPADTALNVLTLFISREEAEQIPTHYQDFKRVFIATLDQHAGGSIQADAIRAWIRKRREGM